MWEPQNHQIIPADFHLNQSHSFIALKAFNASGAFSDLTHVRNQKICKEHHGPSLSRSVADSKASLVTSVVAQPPGLPVDVQTSRACSSRETNESISNVGTVMSQSIKGTCVFVCNQFASILARLPFYPQS